MDLETSRQWLNKWIVIKYGSRHVRLPFRKNSQKSCITRSHFTHFALTQSPSEKIGILFTRDPETGHFLILEQKDDSSMYIVGRY
jgi:hypothetical protein